MMPLGAGKAEVALEKIAKSLLEKDALISGMIVLHRSEIEAGDLHGLLERLGPETPPKDLNVIAASTLLAVEGYVDTDAEIYEIPACREFYQRKCEKWTPWLFAGSIWTADLMAIVLACLPRVICIRRGADLVVRWEAEDMQAFLQKSLPTAAWLHHRAGIGKEDGCSLLMASAAYVGLPFSE